MNIDARHVIYTSLHSAWGQGLYIWAPNETSSRLDGPSVIRSHGEERFFCLSGKTVTINRHGDVFITGERQ